MNLVDIPEQKVCITNQACINILLTSGSDFLLATGYKLCTSRSASAREGTSRCLLIINTEFRSSWLNIGDLSVSRWPWASQAIFTTYHSLTCLGMNGMHAAADLVKLKVLASTTYSGYALEKKVNLCSSLYNTHRTIVFYTSISLDIKEFTVCLVTLRKVQR